MNWTKWLPAVLALVALAGAAGEACAEIRALLVGVSRYSSPQIPTLDGPHNDVPAMRELLLAEGAKDITILQNDAVTRSSLRKALKDLAGRAKPGDWVVFYYAGHGSQAAARDASEVDGLDEFLPLSGFDPARPDPEQFVVDNELRAWLTGYFPKTVNVLQIADACHSGTLNRSFQAETVFKTRQVDLGQAYVLPATGEPVPPAAAGEAPNLVYIGASQDHQFALEGPMPRTVSAPRGVLTYALERVLRDHRADGKLAADLNGDGVLTLNELGAALDVRTRQYSRARQWPSVAIPPNNENSVVFRPLKRATAPAPALRVFAGDAQAAKLLATPGPWAVAAQADADLSWRAGTGEVFDAQGDRIAQGVVDAAGLGGVVNKLQALTLLYPLAREGALAVEIGPRKKGERYRLGEAVQLSVAKAAAGQYVTALNLAGDGTVQLLYPLADEGAGRLTSAAPLTLARTFAAPPFGVDHVLVVASDQPPELFRAAIRRLDGRRNPIAVTGALIEEMQTQGADKLSVALGELYTGE